MTKEKRLVMVGRATISWKTKFLQLQSKYEQLKTMYEEKFAELEPTATAKSNSDLTSLQKEAPKEEDKGDVETQAPVSLNKKDIIAPKRGLKKSTRKILEELHEEHPKKEKIANEKELETEGDEHELPLEESKEETEIKQEELTEEEAEEKYKHKCGECGAYFNELVEGKCPNCSYQWEEETEEK